MSQFALLNKESEQVVSATFNNPETVETFKEDRFGDYQVVELIPVDSEEN